MTDEKLREMLRAGAAPADPPAGARERTWVRLAATPERRTRLVPALAFAALAAAAVSLLVSRRPADERPQPIASMPIVTATGEVERGPNWVETHGGQALVGRAGDALAWVLEGSRFATEEAGRVRLSRGVVRVWAAHRRAGETFEVVTPRHRVVVVGTIFTVRVEGDEIAVWVAKGVVEVWSGDDRDARLAAGEHWTTGGIEPATIEPAQIAIIELAAEGGETRLPEPADEPAPVAAPAPMEEPMAAIEPATPATPRQRERVDAVEPPSQAAVAPAPSPQTSTPAPVPASAAPESAADSLAREAQALEREGRFAEAARKYETIGAGSGPEAGWALYRLGRARHRLGDERGAIAALESYRRRFASGSLRHEVDLSVIEVELARGRNDVALREVEAFLARWPRSERRAEMQRLRDRLGEVE